jgi:pimeloyl-ACP methyl ester carboxylesterase
MSWTITVNFDAYCFLLYCRYFLELSSSRPDTQFALLEGVGHCPQDDQPEQLHKQLLPWLQQRWA